ncbi:MAG: NAD-dependent succinate-semialdehyde dehydrogenase [Candidatus Marinimicrobia bacterium]|nr:NAD-dependent succinate-semialdehyde dehydrogenase [Candidatus Neomarinimicrobiota bacterium]MBT4155129.1 NAD-dependent succinate-semialdehyde dehydrogenase [Candidatus Neomarinimicrobiota bacterium]MBT4752484.1 NAD-dependent succinate-semialdehyde dehydrogenase [Candidatus Neomarinimicrobiota bacterium]MBT5115120.1 NAD-dependent succinate-semialdehyde dehydrogenase [Candidatus Neomarinimicrobiota bacterium]MBT6413096.1 NAD-dependent succinate-semialdehyde dehydrogenase [Candidatus Neomarini
MALVSINPATGKEIQSYPQHSSIEVKYILDQSVVAQQQWKNTSLELRNSCLEQLAGILRDRAKEYSILMAEEMGKPVSQGLGEVEKCASLCEYYKEEAFGFLADKSVEIAGQKSIISIQPMGLILGVMPWNFPFWQVFRFAIPTITAGNGAILKHASNVQGCAFAIEKSFKDSGFPENIFRNIVVPGREMEEVIKHPAIAAITLTGSTPAGKSIAMTAGSVLKKTVLELGGSDPYIILEDANVDLAVDACISGRILNTGQSCIAAKRLIVTENLYDTFLSKLEDKLSDKIMGDPKDDVDIGPMVSIEARDEVHDQVCRSIEAGAKLKLGGIIPKEVGAFYPITLLSEVEPGMTAFDEEIFGPVFTVIKARDEANAIELGNQTEFGLGSAVFTSDLEKGESIAKTQLNVGACFVNDFVKSDPRLPFGGIKESGYGRELSIYGIMEFVNVKTIVVKNA